jgi:acetyl esterase/lipase
MDEGKRLG